MGSFSSRNCLYQRINIGNACVNNEWLNLACNILTKHWLMNMWMWGTTTSCMHATVTRTHGRKNARDTLMHACPSTRRNTHGHAQVLNLHVHAHTYSARWDSDRINSGKCIYWPKLAYYEVHWPYFYKYTVTDSVFISFQKAILTGKEAVWTSITLLCLVNLPNEEKLAGREKLARGGSEEKEKILTNASSPSLRRSTCNS